MVFNFHLHVHIRLIYIQIKNDIQVKSSKVNIQASDLTGKNPLGHQLNTTD